MAIEPNTVNVIICSKPTLITKGQSRRGGKRNFPVMLCSANRHSAPSEKREAESQMGVMCESPDFMTGQFAPQMTIATINSKMLLTLA